MSNVGKGAWGETDDKKKVGGKGTNEGNRRRRAAAFVGWGGPGQEMRVAPHLANHNPETADPSTLPLQDDWAGVQRARPHSEVWALLCNLGGMLPP